MDANNGSLGFDVYFNNEKLNKAVDESEKKIKGLSNSAVKEGEKLDDVLGITADNIRIQKEVIGQLESQLNNLNIEISKMKPGSAQNELRQQASQVTAELKAEKDALKTLETQVNNTEAAHKSYRSQLIALREEMIAMENAGNRDTDAYRKLQREAGSLKDAIGDAQQQMKVLADDERVFKGVISTVSGITGAFSAAQGAVGLFAGENENLNKIMLKVQSLMAITIGLQQVAEMLNKDSYFSVVVLTKAKELFAIAELKLASAFGISTVAAQVLMATLTLGLSVAITAIIVAISRFSSNTAEAKKEMEDLVKSTVDMAIKPVSALEQLSVGWSRLGENIKDKEKFIADNADRFKDLGVNIKDVNQAEEVLNTNKQKFIESLMLRAKALATAELATNKYKEALQKELEMENTPKTVKMQTPSMMGASSISYEAKNKEYEKLQADRVKLEQEGNALFQKSAEFSENEKELLKQLGLSSDNIIAGSVSAMEANIAKLKEAFKNAASDKERASILKDIKSEEKKLKDMYGAEIESLDDKIKTAKEKLTNAVTTGNEKEIKYQAAKIALLEKEKTLREWLAYEAVAFAKGNITQADKDRVKSPTLLARRGNPTIVEKGMFGADKQGALVEITAVDKTGPTFARVRSWVASLSKYSIEKAKEAGKEQEKYDKEALERKENLQKQILDYSRQFTGELINQLGLSEEQNKSLQSAADIVYNLAKGDYIAAGFSGLTLLLSSLNANDKKDTTALALEKVNALLEKQSAILSNISGTNYFDLAAKQYKDLGEAIDLNSKKLRESAALTKQEYEAAKALWDKKGPREKALEPFSEYIKKIRSVTDAWTSQEFLDAFSKGLLELGEQETNWVNAIAEAQKQRAELLQETFRQALGFDADAISAGIFEGISNGLKRGANNLGGFAETFGNLLETALMQSVTDSLNASITESFLPMFQQFKEGGITEQERATLETIYAELIDKAKADSDGIQSIVGKYKTLSQSQLTGAVKGITEDTAGALVGQIMAARVDLKNMSLSLANIAVDTKELKNVAIQQTNILNASLTNLIAIKNNTGETAAGVERLNGEITAMHETIKKQQ